MRIISSKRTSIIGIRLVFLASGLDPNTSTHRDIVLIILSESGTGSIAEDGILVISVEVFERLACSGVVIVLTLESSELSLSVFLTLHYSQFQ